VELGKRIIPRALRYASLILHVAFTLLTRNPDEQNKEQIVRRMQRWIERLGFQVTIASVPTAA